MSDVLSNALLSDFGDGVTAAPVGTLFPIVIPSCDGDFCNLGPRCGFDPLRSVLTLLVDDDDCWCDEGMIMAFSSDFDTLRER